MPQLKNTHQLECRARTIVESLKGTRRQGKGMCCCPAHDDRTPSLSVTLGRKAILFHCFAGCSNEDVIAALDRQGVRSRELFDGLALGPPIGKIRVTSIPMRDACGNRHRRSPTAPSDDISHSAVSSTHLTGSVTSNIRRLGHTGLSNFSLRCWRQSRLTLALSQYTGHFSTWRAASWPVSSGPSARWAALALVPSGLRRQCRGVWGSPKESRAPSQPCSCSGSLAGQPLGTSGSVSFRSRRACASTSCSSTMTPEVLSPSIAAL